MNRNKVKILVMDVDGTLTDGKIYMSNKSELLKVFDIKDGTGIREILPAYGIVPVIMTARESEIVVNRCKELNVTEIYQGIRRKIDKLKELIAIWSEQDNSFYTLGNVAYIGDDIIDLSCMEPIKACGGVIGCPSDAIEEIKRICDFVSSKEGGNGAVREFIEWLVKERGMIM